jgi:hypothetical protein
MIYDDCLAMITARRGRRPAGCIRWAPSLVFASCAPPKISSGAGQRRPLEMQMQLIAGAVCRRGPDRKSMLASRKDGPGVLQKLCIIVSDVHLAGWKTDSQQMSNRSDENGTCRHVTYR